MRTFPGVEIAMNRPRGERALRQQLPSVSREGADYPVESRQIPR
jgi:hypothetical protein